MTITDLPITAKYYIMRNNVNGLATKSIPQIEAYTIINYWLIQATQDSRFSIAIDKVENATRFIVNFGNRLDYETILTILIEW